MGEPLGPRKYQKPVILKTVHFFDVDCSTNEHEIVFTNIVDHLDLERNAQVFSACLDHFGWPEKISVSFSNGAIFSKRKDRDSSRATAIRTKIGDNQKKPLPGSSQDYVFSEFEHNERDFINSELKSIIKINQMNSLVEWSFSNDIPIAWNSQDYNPQFLENFEECRCEITVKATNYILKVHQIGHYIAIRFENRDAPLDLLNLIAQIVDRYKQDDAWLKSDTNESYILEGLPVEGMIDVFRCFSGIITGWRSNFNPKIPGILKTESPQCLPDLRYLKNRLLDIMRLAEELDYGLGIKVSSDSSGISPFKYVILNSSESIGDVALDLLRIKIDDISFWSITITHNDAVQSAELEEIERKFDVRQQFVEHY